MEAGAFFFFRTLKAGIAILSTLYLLFGNAGVISRSRETPGARAAVGLEGAAEGRNLVVCKAHEKGE